MAKKNSLLKKEPRKKKVVRKKKRKYVPNILQTDRIKAGFPTRPAFCKAYKAKFKEDLPSVTMAGYEYGTIERPSERRWDRISELLGYSKNKKTRRYKTLGYFIGGDLKLVAKHELHTSKLGDWHKPKKVRAVSSKEMRKEVTAFAQKNAFVGKKSFLKKSKALAADRIMGIGLLKPTRKKKVQITYCDLKKAFTPFIGKKPTETQEHQLRSLLATLKK